MKPATVRHHASTSVDEAIALLAELARQDGRVLADGQSLVPTMAFRLAWPAHLIDINGIAALDCVGATAIDPIEDVHNSAQCQRDLVRAMVRRALEQAAA
jgi:CO/xanthine dehydrogenase FAD-binding subunit